MEYMPTIPLNYNRTVCAFSSRFNLVSKYYRLENEKCCFNWKIVLQKKQDILFCLRFL